MKQILLTIASASILSLTLAVPRPCEATVPSAVRAAAPSGQQVLRSALQTRGPQAARLLDDLGPGLDRAEAALQRLPDASASSRAAGWITRHGDDVAHAFSRTDEPQAIYRMLRQLPDEEVAAAARLLSSRSRDAAVDAAVSRHGALALRAGARPGVTGRAGIRLAEEAPGEIVERSLTWSPNHVETSAQIMSDLNEAQRAEFFRTLRTAGDEFLAFANTNRRTFLVVGVGGAVVWKFDELLASFVGEHSGSGESATFVPGAATRLAEAAVAEVGEAAGSSISAVTEAVADVATETVTTGNGRLLQPLSYVVALLVLLLGLLKLAPWLVRAARDTLEAMKETRAGAEAPGEAQDVAKTAPATNEADGADRPKPSQS